MPLKKSIQSTGSISHGTKLFEMKLRCDRPTQKFQWVRIVDSFSGPQPVVTALRCDYSASIFYFTKFATFTPFEESAIPVRNRVYWLSSLPDKFPTFFPSHLVRLFLPIFYDHIIAFALISFRHIHRCAPFESANCVQSSLARPTQRLQVTYGIQMKLLQHKSDGSKSPQHSVHSRAKTLNSQSHFV